MIFLIIGIIYSDTLASSWHLDDYPNIIENPLIHLSTISIKSLLRASNLLQDQNLYYSGVSYRPLSFLSFALNWYINKDHVFGYHIVNIAIHILCAGSLYILLFYLLNTPKLIGRYDSNNKNIALLSTILWAVHPIQSQAVTYIVQRMTLLATLFYLLGMICYVKARIINNFRQRLSLYIGCFCCFLLALGSKENALMLPLSIGLIEIIFFQKVNSSVTRIKCFRMALSALFTTSLMSILLAYVIKLNPISFIHHLLETRDFTLIERLLTEPRIVIGYLIQIFYPVLSRFSIDHSITVSTSLFHPITTLLSILFILGLIFLAMVWIQKYPILSFGILFYFLNHIMESSVLPLELIFEHRNYLPSLFIFFPIAAGLVHLINYYQKEKRPFMASLVCSLTAISIITLAVTTYFRNSVWVTEKTLWEDALLKAPNSARPYGRLAYYYDMAGQYDTALSFYKTSLTKKWERKSNRSVTLLNMARIYASKRDYSSSIELYDQMFELNQKDYQPMFLKAKILIIMDKWDEAKKIANILMAQKYIPWDDFNLMGLILLKENNPEGALDHFRRALNRYPHNPEVYMNIGISLSRMNYFQKADWFFKQALQMGRNDIDLLLCLLNNHMLSGNNEAVTDDVNMLLKNFSLAYLQDALQNLDQNRSSISKPAELFTIVVEEKLKSTLTSMEYSRN